MVELLGLRAAVGVAAGVPQLPSQAPAVGQEEEQPGEIGHQVRAQRPQVVVLVATNRPAFAHCAPFSHCIYGMSCGKASSRTCTGCRATYGPAPSARSSRGPSALQTDPRLELSGDLACSVVRVVVGLLLDAVLAVLRHVHGYHHYRRQCQRESPNEDPHELPASRRC